MLPIDLSKRVCVVTGGSGELGRVIARTLARAGADIAIHYHKNEEKARELLAAVQRIGRQAMIVQADVTDLEQVLRMRDQVKMHLGSADIIVNNAVVQYKWVSVLDQPASDYESQFRSCVLHNVYMAKAFVPDMVEKRHGRVIAINTECAMQNFATQSAYVSGKRGMDGVLRVLAKEVGEHQVTVNQVAPGWMVSDRDRANGTEQGEAYEKGVPLRRRGTDQDVANAVAFLASDMAGYITGAYLPVCGGTVMPGI